MDLAARLRLKLWDLRGRCGHHARLLVDVEVGDKPGLAPGADQAEHPPLPLQLGHTQHDPRLQASQGKVVVGDFRGQRNLAVVLGPGLRLGGVPGRFPGPARAAEQVDFPGGVEPRRIEVGVSRNGKTLRRAAAGAAGIGARSPGVAIGIERQSVPRGADARIFRRPGDDLLLPGLAHA